MRMLVISSCTGRKRGDRAKRLKLADFQEPALFAQRAAALQRWRCPASAMYTGRPHTLLMEGLSLLRQAGVQADLKIISAGYGLIDEDQEIVPYDVSFSSSEDFPKIDQVKAWADRLQLPQAVREAVAGYPLVFFLLGDRYLAAIQPGPWPGPGQKFIFLARPAEAKRLQRPGTVLVPAGTDQCGRYGAVCLDLKGAMFRALAAGVARDSDRWLAVLRAAETYEAVEALMSEGLAAGVLP